MPVPTLPTRFAYRRGSLSVASGSAARGGLADAVRVKDRLGDETSRADSLWGPRVDLALRHLERARRREAHCRDEVERLERTLQGGAGEARLRRADQKRLHQDLAHAGEHEGETEDLGRPVIAIAGVEHEDVARLVVEQRLNERGELRRSSKGR